MNAKRGRRRDEEAEGGSVVAYPTVEYMRTLPPVFGKGITDPMIESALWVAIAQVVAVTDGPEGHETSGVPLTWCPAGMLVLVGGKTLLSWDRLVLAEPVEY